jgi:hypothetical protein
MRISLILRDSLRLTMQNRAVCRHFYGAGFFAIHLTPLRERILVVCLQAAMHCARLWEADIQ